MYWPPAGMERLGSIRLVTAQNTVTIGVPYRPVYYVLIDVTGLSSAGPGLFRLNGSTANYGYRHQTSAAASTTWTNSEVTTAQSQWNLAATSVTTARLHLMRIWNATNMPTTAKWDTTYGTAGVTTPPTLQRATGNWADASLISSVSFIANATSTVTWSVNSTLMVMGGGG